MMNSLERMERLLAIAEEGGIQVRNEWLGGVRGGLVRVGETPILFVDDSLEVQEQLAQARSALARLDWSESQWWNEMETLLQES